MSELFGQIHDLINGRDVRVSEHGYDELAEDGLSAKELIAGVGDAVIVEEYPGYGKGPCILLLQEDRMGRPVHVVWGIPRGLDKPAVLVTAYRPDPKRWVQGWLRREPI